MGKTYKDNGAKGVWRNKRMVPEIREHCPVGPGGTQCACCFPAPGSKERKAMFRTAKHRAKKRWQDEAKEDSED